MTVSDEDMLRERLYRAYASQHSGHSNGKAARLMYRRELRPLLPPRNAGIIVDIGCGQGELVGLMCEDGYDAEGIDISSEQVMLARASGVLKIYEADYREGLARRPGQVAAVIATDMLEHLTKIEVLEAFDTIAAALKPGGLFIGRVPNAVSPFGGLIRFGDFTHESWFTAQSIRQLAAAAKFDSVQVVECQPPVHGLLSAMRLASWLSVSALYRVILATETGKVSGHVVTQNLAFAARKSHED